MSVEAGTLRHDWTVDEIVALHELPLLELIGRANETHRRHHDPNAVQKASLLSIKTGGCPENCVTLGILKPHQAERLADAGLTAYNHNLDTSPEFYGKIITTRTYEDRLETLATVRSFGIDLCCGGIIGMGETIRDRASMLQVLAAMDPHPESVPVNALVPVAGTPLANRPPVAPLDLVRMVSTARLVMPRTTVRLSAGRSALNREAQILCLVAGANSVFYGDTLLTTPNAGIGEDAELFAALGTPERANTCASAA